jgi:hypothetical protein
MRIMFIKTKLPVVLLGAAALALLWASSLRSADQLDAETKARVERFERGPSTINVSKYPAGIQADYEVFSQKCSQCHKLSRPINSDYALPEEWSRYIKRMMNKPGSGISRGDGKKIYDFLVYDASIRKKAMVAAKLAKAPAAEKAEAEAKIKEVHSQYDK